MMPRIAITLVLGTLLCGATLAAQNTTSGEKKAAPAQKVPRTFAQRPTAAEPAKTAVEEPVVKQEPINPAFPYQAGIGPMAPTVCRHDDLNRDLEFRMCMDQLLDTSPSFRN